MSISKVKNLIFSLFNKLKNGGFMHLVGSSVINKVLTFCSSIILVRLIPKADYGVYSNANNILSFFILLEGFGMATALLQFGCTNTGEKKKNVWSFCFNFAMAFQLVLCVAIAITGKFATFKIEGTGEMLLLMSFLPLLRLISELQRVYMRTDMMNKQYAFTNNFSTATTVIFSIILSYFFLVNGMIAAQYISAFATVLFILFRYKIKLPSPKNNLEKKEKVELVKFATIATINNSTASVMSLLGTFILGIVIGESEVTASYKVATTIPTALTFIPTCIMTYIYPYFAKQSDNAKWCIKNFKKVLILFGAFNVALVGTMIIGADIIVPLVFGEQYIDAIPAFRILCLNYILHSTLRTIPGQLLVTQKKLKFNTFVGVSSGLLGTLFNILLVPSYSSTGSALATLLVTCIFAVITPIYLYNVYRKKLKLQSVNSDTSN